MFENEIENIFKDNRLFLGAFARDDLPIVKKLPAGLIINMDKRNQPGSHWVAVFINRNGYGEYFDSYGIPATHFEIITFLNNNCPKGYFSNLIPLQCLTCVTCGEYCVAYLMTRLKGGSYKNFISLFNNNTFDNDKIIKMYFNLF